MSTRHYIIPVFIPDLACPHQCVFCNQKNISGRMGIPDASEVQNIVSQHLSTIPKNQHAEIGFFGGNFTGVELSKQDELLSSVQSFIHDGLIKCIRISTRPDYINKDILGFLKEKHVGTIELGAQSFDDNVLRLSGRGHDAEATIAASKLIKANNFKLGLQMMVGLPGDSIEKLKETTQKIIDLKADCTRIYPVIVIKNTLLEKLFLENRYQPLTLEAAVRQTKEIYRILEDAGINILRVGLHPSEGLLSKNTYLAGPFHVSFRELVLTDIWREIFEPLLEKPDNRKIEITVSKSQMKHAIGYSATNKKMLQKHFSHVKFVVDLEMEGRNYHAHYC